MGTSGCINGLHCRVDVRDRLHLGQHDVTPPRTGQSDQDGDILFKSRMTQGVNSNRYTGIGDGAGGQAEHQFSMVLFATHGRTVFAIQGDVHDAHTKFLVQLGLQLQAFAHANFHAAVVVTDGQYPCGGLRTQQDLARMFHVYVNPSLLEQMGHTGLFVGQLFECFINASLAEGINGQAFDHFVFAVVTSDRETKHHIFGNAIPTL